MNRWASITTRSSLAGRNDTIQSSSTLASAKVIRATPKLNERSGSSAGTMCRWIMLVPIYTAVYSSLCAAK